MDAERAQILLGRTRNRNRIPIRQQHRDGEKPPIAMPSANNRFHPPSRLQSYAKKGKPLGMVAAHRCRRFDEMPKDLPPISKSNGTIRPINGPATNHGQGSHNICIICPY